jgi:hypothetical protein
MLRSNIEGLAISLIDCRHLPPIWLGADLGAKRMGLLRELAFS